MTSALLNRPSFPLVDDAAVVLQRRARAHARGMERRQPPGEEAREQDQPAGEQQDAVVEAERDPERRRVHRDCLREPAHAEDAEQQADRAARDRQHQHLGEVLPDDAPAAGAQRDPDRHFALPERRARDEQVRHVDARDEQHADACAEHRVEERVDLGPERDLRVRQDVGGHPFVRRRELGLELRGNRPRLRFRLGQRHVRLEQPHHLVRRPVGARLGERTDHERDPELLLERKAERLRHHADDRPVDAAGPHGPADHVRSAAVLLLPQVVAEQHDRRGGRTIVTLAETAADHRVHAQHPEDGHRQFPRREPLRAPLLGRQVDRRDTDRPEHVERGLPLLPGGHVVHADRPARLPLGRVGRDERHDPVGVPERQPLEETAVDDAEDGRAQAEAEAERHDGHQGQRRILHEHPHAGLDIAQELVHDSQDEQARHDVRPGAGTGTGHAAVEYVERAAPQPGAAHRLCRLSAPVRGTSALRVLVPGEISVDSPAGF